MTEPIYLFTFDNKRVKTYIDDFEHLRGVIIKCISGDHVMTPVYEDGGYGPTIDPNKNWRSLDMYDWERFVEAPDITYYNSLTTGDQLISAAWAEDTGVVEPHIRRRSKETKNDDDI